MPRRITSPKTARDRLRKGNFFDDAYINSLSDADAVRLANVKIGVVARKRGRQPFGPNQKPTRRTSPPSKKQKTTTKRKPTTTTCVNKCYKHQLKTGPQGGKYYVAKSGRKMYVSK